jgi:hypothetical protein
VLHRPRPIATVALSVALAAALTGLAGCGDRGPNGYDDSVRRTFLEACEATKSTALCRCLYDRIVDQIPFDRFEEIDRELSATDAKARDVPDDLAALAIGCATDEVIGG